MNPIPEIEPLFAAAEVFPDPDSVSATACPSVAGQPAPEPDRLAGSQHSPIPRERLARSLKNCRGTGHRIKLTDSVHRIRYVYPSQVLFQTR